MSRRARRSSKIKKLSREELVVLIVNDHTFDKNGRMMIKKSRELKITDIIINN